MIEQQALFSKSRRIIAGNWKMHGTRKSVQELCAHIAAALSHDPAVLVFPSFVHLESVQGQLGEHCQVGAQDISQFPGQGAYTGEVSGDMLRDLGIAACLVGHSERRHVLGEPGQLIRLKVERAWEAGLGVMLCVGETESERDLGATRERLRHQLRGALGQDKLNGPLAVAYEPVWAIGTGRPATMEQVELSLGWLREELAGIGHDPDLPVLYGGSVNVRNAQELLAIDGLDGLLIGGASLQAEAFLEILAQARH